MKKEKVKLTKTFIDSLDAPEDGNRLTYWDEELKGFCIRVSKGKKVYYAVKRVGRKLQWVNIGVHGPMNPLMPEGSPQDLSRTEQRGT